MSGHGGRREQQMLELLAILGVIVTVSIALLNKN